MSKTENLYDDGNVPDIDLPNSTGVTDPRDKESDSRYCSKASNRVVKPAEPLPESSRPRKDGPGGD